MVVRPATSWWWMGAVSGVLAFILGLGVAWVWLQQRPGTGGETVGGWEAAQPVPPSGSSAPLSSATEQAAVVSPVIEPRTPAASVAPPAVAAAQSERQPSHGEPARGDDRTQPAQARSRASPASPKAASAAAPIPKGGGDKGHETDRKAPRQRDGLRPQAQQVVRSWQRSGQWVLLLQQAAQARAPRLRAAEEQLAPLVPPGLQLMRVNRPRQKGVCLVLGPFASEQAAEAALWQLPTSFLLKQPQPLPAHALF